jgi:CheY-like chemotaxis protein
MQRRESIGVLSSGIAHDFNNLLGSMMGNISLAQATVAAGHPSLKNMEKALVAMERAAQLTKQMLAYSGKGKFQICTIDITSAVRENVNLFNASLPKNVKLVTHLPSKPVCVIGDTGQIDQIIMNLIINSGEAIGEKQGVVSVTLTAATMWCDELIQYGRITNTTLTEGCYALIEVSDHGIGMSQETIHKIFDPFFTTKFTGRGLGLSAVLGIVRGHRGGITVESHEGEGTTFRVIIPAVASPVITEKTAVGSETIVKELVKTTILVIDDEADVAAMAQEILESNDYTTLVELNPIEGIELYKQHQSEIGAVLLDMTMPEMSGKEVVDALQAIDPDVKILITSGYSEEEVERKIGNAKVTGFIQKPYRMRALLTKVHSVLH